MIVDPLLRWDFGAEFVVAREQLSRRVQDGTVRKVGTFAESREDELAVAKEAQLDLPTRKRVPGEDRAGDVDLLPVQNCPGGNGCLDRATSQGPSVGEELVERLDLANVVSSQNRGTPTAGTKNPGATNGHRPG
jgi:hypothetical protein